MDRIDTTPPRRLGASRATRERRAVTGLRPSATAASRLREAARRVTALRDAIEKEGSP